MLERSCSLLLVSEKADALACVTCWYSAMLRLSSGGRSL